MYRNIPRGWAVSILVWEKIMPTGSATAQEQQLVPERGPKGPQGRTGKSSADFEVAKCYEQL